MRPIPPKMRKQIALDPFMKKCIYDHIGRGNECRGRIEWEHTHNYAGKQINEPWAIVPCCTYHHRGAGLDKDFNRYMAIMRADIEDLQVRMPRQDWAQQKKYLMSKYKGVVTGGDNEIKFVPPHFLIK